MERGEEQEQDEGEDEEEKERLMHLARRMRREQSRPRLQGRPQKDGW